MKKFLRALPLFLIVGCSKQPRFVSEWAVNFNSLGSGSSPQCADLNRDDVLDIVIGASRNEFEASDSSVLALDGRTGKILWMAFAKDQIVGSASFLDVTGDSIPEVYIGGRGSEFMCLDGATGKPVWRFKPSNVDPITRCCLRFNFFNAQFIPDQDGDGLQDILASNGGNAKARPNSEVNRFPGVLAIFNSKTGSMIAADTMPDGKETYMSPVVCDIEKNGRLTVVFGTGGETIGGNLFRVALQALRQNDISKATRIASVENRGFIAPPTLADVTQDGINDIIVNWFGGKMMAIDGKSNTVLWERRIPETEIYSSPVPGYFNDDEIPDFFSSYNKGAWPNNTGSIQVLLNGKTGDILFSDSLGCMGYSSAVTCDINHDNFDEVIWSVNDFACVAPSFVGTDIPNDNHTLHLLDYHNNARTSIFPLLKAKNISSTPWIGDLDNDHYLDLVYCTQQNTFVVDQYNGIRIERARSAIKMRNKPTWGAYMGNDGTGVFTRKKLKE